MAWLTLIPAVTLCLTFPVGGLTEKNESVPHSPVSHQHGKNTTDLFVDYIFRKYSRDPIMMSFEGYEHLMENLDLGGIHIDHRVQNHLYNASAEFDLLHNDHMHQEEPEMSSEDEGDEHSSHTSGGPSNVHHQHALKKRGAETNKAHTDTHDHLFKKCYRPLEILRLFQFGDQGLTKDQFVDLCPALIVQLDGHTCSQVTPQGQGGAPTDQKVTWEIWLYACAAILVISVSGLICVGVVSLLHGILVQNVLHVLVAMAVGALTGDAMLHLLPHVLTAGGHSSSNMKHSSDGVYKGLAGLSAFYVFFLVGRLQNIFGDKKSKRKQRRQREIEDMEISILETKMLKSPDDEGSEVKNGDSKVPEDGHHHGHSHGDAPQTPGAMVWRVIVGDGIHNLSDGLAIGVAFSDSVISGLSTSIAVLCHELPHEIGDFAVLLKKGMSIKMAMGFNLLSSVLSMIGVLAGVAMGNIASVKFYILGCVAGMFIYISLVDMLPEISTNPGKNPVKHLLTTLLGIGIGSGIMLTIALNENELKAILAS